MILIQRTKGDAVHYAAAVAPAGNVTAWVAAPDKAQPVAPEVAAKVRDFHKGKENAGTLAFLDADGGGPATLAPANRSGAEADLAAYLELDDAPPAEVARVALGEIKLLESEVARLKAPPPKPGKADKPKDPPPKAEEKPREPAPPPAEPAK